jgi:hypothetical protein
VAAAQAAVNADMVPVACFVDEVESEAIVPVLEMHGLLFLFLDTKSRQIRADVAGVRYFSTPHPNKTGLIFLKKSHKNSTPQNNCLQGP